ncbi:hypothetical protein FLAG1_08622 [Fusarium langsethiae]|uniref:Uncharacterized protein n=1 Tax=Fusarium langsethiae TaxID=179993 RepID=A0A0M9ERP8_FUSLA|nr:hypothetical protein FLAG1_08622 [Fusarium langsethiae]
MSFLIFNEATTSFIVPLCLLAINLVGYLYTYEASEARLAGANCLLSIYLLSSYFSGDRSPQPVTNGDVKSPLNLDTETEAKQTQKKFRSEYAILGPAPGTTTNTSKKTLSMVVTDFYYDEGCPEFIPDPPCAPFFGQSGPAGSITYSYQGLGYCDTSAQRGIITNAVINYISERGSKLSSTECLELGEHSTEFLAIGPTDGFDFGINCWGKEVFSNHR